MNSVSQNCCRGLAVSIVHDAVDVSENRYQHSLIIKELKSLFSETVALILTENSPTYADPQQEIFIQGDNLSNASESQEFGMAAVSFFADDSSSNFQSAALVIAAFIRRFIVVVVDTTSHATVFFSGHDDHNGPILSASSNSVKIPNEFDDKETREHAVSEEILPSQDSYSNENTPANLESYPKPSNFPNVFFTEDFAPDHSLHEHAKAYQDFECLDLFTLANDGESHDIGKLLSDMIDCVDSLWIDIAPLQTPATAVEHEEEHVECTFHYSLPMVTPTTQSQHLKPCSWGFYLCVTIYTRQDLVRISAVQSGQELPLLSLNWVDFTKMCCPCDAGVRIFPNQSTMKLSKFDKCICEKIHVHSGVGALEARRKILKSSLGAVSWIVVPMQKCIKFAASSMPINQSLR
jgi:hypothetical protein